MWYNSCGDVIWDDDLINHRKVESARIEYKKGWNPEKVFHLLCAFANDIDNWGGGYVILGVEEKDGKLVFSAMRRNGSPDPIFSSPETRDWLSVVLPIHRVFDLRMGAISAEPAPKIAQRIAPILGGARVADDSEKTADRNGKVCVISDVDEWALIKVALKVALKTTQRQKSEKIVDRLAKVLQAMLRNRHVTMATLSKEFNVSLRSLRMDIALMKDISVLDRVGSSKDGEWVVLLKY